MTRKEYNICVDKTADKLYRFCLKLTKHKQDAQDIVQFSFEKLWRNRETVDREAAQAWLFTTARHIMIDNHRRSAREAKILHLKANSHEHYTENNDTKDLLEKAFKVLSPEHKRLILLRDYEGYSYKEIATMTELSMSQVKVYLFRARKALKDWIGENEKNKYDVYSE